MEPPVTDCVYTPTSSNTKTGNIPQVWVGGTEDQGRASCDKVECPMRPWAGGPVKCYAWVGTARLGYIGVLRNPAQHTLEQAVARRHPSARAIRVGAIGDPGVLPKRWWTKIHRVAAKENLQVLSYTHGWRKRPDLAGMTVASCDSLEDVVQARAMGFQAAVVLPGFDSKRKTFTLPDGTKGLVCPNMYSKAVGKVPITCNDCLLCTGKSDKVIGFPEHGPGVKK